MQPPTSLQGWERSWGGFATIVRITELSADANLFINTETFRKLFTNLK